MGTFIFGFFGGMAVNLLRLLELVPVRRADRPDTFSDPLYVLQFVVLPLLGGGLAYAYTTSGTPLTPILAVNIGASAPLILKNFAAALPPIGARRID
jgi:hypothetical protein